MRVARFWAVCLSLAMAKRRGAAGAEDRSSPELVVVVHSGMVETNATSHRLPWLEESGVPHVIVGGKTGDDKPFPAVDRRRLMYVNYDDNPGCAHAKHPRCDRPSYERIGKYFGAHRTVAGVLVANDTWPGASWVLVVDDDNFVDVGTVKGYLDKLDSAVPLLLSGRIGPGHNDIPCRKLSNGTHWSCCTDPSAACKASLYGEQAVWEYSKTERTFLPRVCPAHATSNECCRTSPWAAGVSRGFPYKIDGDGSFRPHFAKLWPYGGAGYVLSRALLDAIPRAHWEHCMYALQCANADHRVMGCVLAAGFSVTRVGASIPGIVHHVKQGARMADLNSHQKGHIAAGQKGMVPLHRAHVVRPPDPAP